MAKRAAKQTKPTDQVKQVTELLGGKKPTEPLAPVVRRHFSPEEHIAWVEEWCYRDAKIGGWSALRYAGWQQYAIRKLWALRPDGTLRYRTIMPCLPRRCGKSEITGLYDLHRAYAYEDQVIVIQANAEDQGIDTVFKTIVDTLQNSPGLQEAISKGQITVLTDCVLFANGSIIKVQPAKEASTYGQRISVYHNTELCKAPSDATYQVGASSTGDAWCGLTIADSNMGDAANAINRMVEKAQLAESEEKKAFAENRPPDLTLGNPATGCVYLHFDDLADVLKRGCGEGLEAGIEPIHPWLDADWVRSRYADMTASEFRRNHCNLPSGSGEVLWSDEQIDPLFRPNLRMYLRPADLAAFILSLGGIPTWTIGVGLDRAGAFSKLPDRTILSAVARFIVPALAGKPSPVYDPLGQQVAQQVSDGSLYVLVGAWEYMYQLRDPIQDKVGEIDRVWGIDGMHLEAYQASDLAEWCEGQRFGDRTEILHMTAPAKHQLVSFMHSLIITRRFLASPGYYILHREFAGYREESGGSTPGYGGKRTVLDIDAPDPVSEAFGIVPPTTLIRRRTWVKDDYLESLMWAIDAARAAKPKGRGRVIAKPAGL